MVARDNRDEHWCNLSQLVDHVAKHQASLPVDLLPVEVRLLRSAASSGGDLVDFAVVVEEVMSDHEVDLIHSVPAHLLSEPVDCVLSNLALQLEGSVSVHDDLADSELVDVEIRK